VTRRRRAVGLLPAAGLGRRSGAKGPKELLSLEVHRAVPICNFALAALRAAGVERVVVVVSPEKPELCSVLGSGDVLGLELTYVVQLVPRGLPDVVRCAREALGNNDVLFAMPDTVFSPSGSLALVRQELQERAADLWLGVFPTDVPTQLAPVELDATGRVCAIHDKPAATSLRNTWGVLAWSSRFSDLCCEYEARRHGLEEGKLTSAMEEARARGLAVGAHSFPQGWFCDGGTPEGLTRARALWSQSGLASRGDRRTSLLGV
jgi:glucose-1-phosphate thymidylyltransferase